MAHLEIANIQHLRPKVAGDSVAWRPGTGEALQKLPLIFWDSGEPWSEANQWALAMVTENHRKIRTVLSAMRSLLTYATWLETEDISWSYFPVRGSDRCLTRYRGYLVQCRDRRQLAPSTVSQRMSAAVRFYRWASGTGLISPEWPMWEDRIIGIQISDQFGLQHTLRRITTNLSIPNRKRAGVLELEEGLMPVSRQRALAILDAAKRLASKEIYLMLLIGFSSGMRVGSICDLKENTLRNAVPIAGGWYELQIGPGARPSVNTKFDVNGRVLLPATVFDLVFDYLNSTRRLLRKANSESDVEELIFITARGHSYQRNENGAVNTAMSELRAKAKKEGLKELNGFRFHQSRATFTTILMVEALNKFPSVSAAVQFVKNVCLHRDVATTMKYVNFVETTDKMAELADAFTEMFASHVDY